MIHHSFSKILTLKVLRNLIKSVGLSNKRFVKIVIERTLFATFIFSSDLLNFVQKIFLVFLLYGMWEIFTWAAVHAQGKFDFLLKKLRRRF